MKIKIEDHYRFIVYTMAGRLDQPWAEKFKKRLLFEIGEKALARRQKFDVIIDLFGVTDIAPGAVKVMGEINEALQRKGICLALCNLEPEVERELKAISSFPDEVIFPSLFSAKLELSNVANE